VPHWGDLLHISLVGDTERAAIENPDESTDYACFNTPPELFPFGSLGSDGAHLGFVVHAPELHLRSRPGLPRAADLPVGGSFIILASSTDERSKEDSRIGRRDRGQALSITFFRPVK